MDIFSLLSYLNKISLFAFFITTLVVAYQIYLLKKEKTKEQVPTIPDFKEKNNFNEAANFTSLPGSLIKKELKAVNYSKLIFSVISLLTITVIFFILTIIKKNNTPLPTEKIITKNLIPSPKAVTPTEVPSPSPTETFISPSPTETLSPTSTEILISPSPTETIETLETPSPTEIILAKQTLSVTPAESLTGTSSSEESTSPKILPTTGSIEKGLLIIGVAISTIFFSFWF